MKKIKNNLKYICFFLSILFVIIGIYSTPSKKVKAASCTTEETLYDTAYLDISEKIVKQYDAGYLNVQKNGSYYWLYKISGVSGNRPYKNGAGANNFDQASYNDWIYRIGNGWENYGNPYYTSTVFPFTYTVAPNYRITGVRVGRVDSKSDFYNYSCSSNNGISGGENLVTLRGTTSAKDAGICNLSLNDFETCSLTYGDNFYNDIVEKSNGFDLNKTVVSNIPSSVNRCHTITAGGTGIDVIFTPAQYVFSLKPSGLKEVEYKFSWEKEEGKEVTGAYVDYFKSDNDYAQYKNTNNNWVPNDFKEYSLLESENTIGWDSANGENKFDKEDISYDPKTNKYSVTVKVRVNFDNVPEDKISYYDTEYGNVYFVPIKLNVQYSGCQCDQYKSDNNQSEYESNGCCSSLNDHPNGWCCQSKDFFEKKNPTTGENINSDSCCTKEKNYRLSGNKFKFYPAILEDKYEENCPNTDTCAKLEYFNNNKVFCCDEAKKEKNNGQPTVLPIPNDYSHWCPTGGGGTSTTNTCSNNETFFRENKISCCTKSTTDNSAYDLSERDKNDENKCGVKINDDLRCDRDSSVSSYSASSSATGSDKIKVSTSDKLEVVKSPDQRQVLLGKGFEFPIKFKNSTTIKTEYDSTNLGDMTERQANDLKARVNNSITTSITKLNNNINRNYPDQKIKFNVPKYEEYLKNKIGESYPSYLIPGNMIIENNTKYTFGNTTEKEFNYNDSDNKCECTTNREGVTSCSWEKGGRCGSSKEGSYKEETINISIINQTLENTFTMKIQNSWINKTTAEVRYQVGSPTPEIEWLNGENKFYTNQLDPTQTVDFNVSISSAGATGEIKTNSDDYYTCQYLGYNCLTDEICPTLDSEIEGNCKDIDIFDKNTGACCQLEYNDGKRGNYLPIGYNYDNYCNDGTIEGSGYYFKPIALDNPFPNRVAGKNWNLNSIKTYITNKKDNVYGETPMYQITLTSDLIKEIKEYNKNHNYLNWSDTMTSTNNQAISKFLTGSEVDGFGFMKNKITIRRGIDRKVKIGEN